MMIQSVCPDCRVVLLWSLNFHRYCDGWLSLNQHHHLGAQHHHLGVQHHHLGAQHQHLGVQHHHISV